MRKFAGCFLTIAVAAFAASTPSNSQTTPEPLVMGEVAYRFALAENDSKADAIQKDFQTRFQRFGLTGSEHSTACRYSSSGPAYRCIVKADEKVFIGSYPLPNGSALTTQYAPSDLVGWAKVNAVKDGQSEFSRVLDLADKRTLVGCADGNCSVVVHTYRRPDLAESSDVGADILSVCSVAQSGSAVGPPTGCSDIAYARGGTSYIKAVIGQVRLAPGTPVPTPKPTVTPAIAYTPVPGRRPKARDLLGDDKDVAVIVRRGSLTDAELEQATCKMLATKAIVCGHLPRAVAGKGSRFFTDPLYFEMFNLNVSMAGQSFDGAPSFTVAVSLTDLLVSFRYGDGFGPADSELRSRYRKNVVVLEKQALFGLCQRHNIINGSDNDEQPTVFECFR
jgi:hypothetical protein